MDDTIGIIMYHTRNAGFDGKENINRKTIARRWKIIETFRPRNTQTGKYDGGKKKGKLIL
jgi:hypothetical protein